MENELFILTLKEKAEFNRHRGREKGRAFQLRDMDKTQPNKT